MMAGCVLVVSLLFSPGMLPAERPSHLYLNLMPLGLGCSMISMKEFAAEREREKYTVTFIPMGSHYYLNVTDWHTFAINVSIV